MIKGLGKISTFGGPRDKGMNPIKEGLALYWEDKQCDTRPDLFLSKAEAFGLMDPEEVTKYGVTPENIQTCKRLNPKSLYIALRYSEREMVNYWRETWYQLKANGVSIYCPLVDWGPNDNTGRMCDISPAAAKLLQLETDESVELLQVG